MNMSDNSKELYDTLESFIKDDNKKSKKHWCLKNELPSLSYKDHLCFERVAFSRPEYIEFYGYGYELFGSKDFAFYKSSDKTVYYIEFLNNVPYRHHKIC